MRIVVIGAGILGASAGYHLARDGVAVTIVDATRAGRATAAGAGILCPWASGVTDPDFYRLYAAGARYYADLIPALDAEGAAGLGFRRSGALVVSADPDELTALEARLRRRRAEAPEMGAIARLTPGEARALFPPLRAGLAGVHIAGGARVDGRLLAAALLRAAVRHGAVLREADAVLLAGNGRVHGVRIGAETIAADTVVLAAGAWAPALLQPLGIDLPIAPQRGQIMHLHLPGQATEAWPVVLPPGDHYLVPFDASRVVVGATRETGAGFDHRATAAGQAQVLAAALGVAPGLAAATVIETRIGFRPMGPDVRPRLGVVPGMAGLVIGNGLGAAGLTIGPFAGRLLAEVVREQPTALDLAPFAPLREAEPAPAQPALR